MKPPRFKGHDITRLAAESALSVETVRNVLNGREWVRPASKRAVELAAVKLGLEQLLPVVAAK